MTKGLFFAAVKEERAPRKNILLCRVCVSIDCLLRGGLIDFLLHEEIPSIRAHIEHCRDYRIGTKPLAAGVARRRGVMQALPFVNEIILKINP